MKYLVALSAILFSTNFVIADVRVFSPEDFQLQLVVNTTPTPWPSPSPEPSSSPSPDPSPDPSVPPNNICTGTTLKETLDDFISAFDERERINNPTNPHPFQISESVNTDMLELIDADNGIWFTPAYGDDRNHHGVVCQVKSDVSSAVQLLNNNFHWEVNLHYDPNAIDPNDPTNRQYIIDAVLATDAPFGGLAGLHNDSVCYECTNIRNGGCFPPGTNVAAKDGTSLEKVENIRAGDYLWNPITRENQKVLKIIEGGEDKPLISIISGDLILNVTTEHPIFTTTGFKQAQGLSLGDIILDGNGVERNIDKIEILPRKQGQTVINFVLESRGGPNDDMILAEGIVVGDLTAQKALAKRIANKE